MTSYRFVWLLPAFLVFALTACDSGDPIEGPKAEDVAGIYQFAEYTFVPTAPSVDPANVRARLDTSATDLQLSSNGNFLLRYQFKSGGPFFLVGEFGVTARTIRLVGSRDKRADFQRILLDEEFTLQRAENSPGVLTASIQKVVNLEAFDPVKYPTLTSIQGTLHLRLVRR